MELKLALIGFGVVGQGLAKLLVEKKAQLKKRYGVTFKVTAISDFVKGAILDPKGIDLKKALKAAEGGKNLETLKVKTKGLDALKTIKQAKADVVVEATFTDLKTGMPAIKHVEQAFKSKAHVVTCNKGPVALAHKRLSNLAKKHGVTWRYEGTVMSGTPVISLAKEAMAGAEITAVRGILNGTTNYMLCEMEKGVDYKKVLKKAQKLGYAEADPTGDVEGFDAMGKVIILANTLMGVALTEKDVQRKGITKITQAMIKKATQKGKRYKLIGEVKKGKNGKIQASVKPTLVDANSFLGSVSGPRNAISFDTDTLGEVSITGPGAGKIETGFSLLSDLLELAWGLSQK